MQLKYKVLLTISTLLLVASIASSVLNYRADVKTAQKQLIDVALPLSVDNIYTEIQQRMIEPLIVSSLMANDTFVKDWLLSGEKKEGLIKKYLLEIQKKYNVFTTFLVSDFSKNYYHSTGLIDVLNQKNQEDDWFFDFKRSGKEYEVNLDYNQNLAKSLIMFINQKVSDYTGEYIGAIGIGIELFDIESMLDSFKEKYHYDVYFVDKNGELKLFSKSLNKRGNIENIPGLRENKDKILQKNSLLIEYTDRNNNEYFLNTKYIERLDLHLLVEINKKEYMQELDKKFYINLAFSIIVTLAIVLFIVYVINIYQKQLERLAGEDALTALANRREFNSIFQNVLKNYQKNTKHITLLLVDLDNFKMINDTYGHLVGDKILKRVAEILRENFRSADKIARWGGEEFSVLLINTTVQDAEKIANKLCQKVREDKKILDVIEKPLTISVGIGELKAADSQDGLIQKVDKALYKAKEEGKNRVVLV